jgi:UDP-N-acetylglucosamine acyltransferase
MEIHSTAVISKKTKISDNVAIGPFTVIEDDVTIADGTKIGAHCVIKGNTSIGKNCEIFTGVVLGEKPQDRKYKGEKTYLEIGDYNIIREYCFFNPGTGEGGKTIIGSHNLFMGYSHIAHDCCVGSHCIMVNSGTLGGHVILEDYAMVSGLSGVHQFVRVGKLSIIGGCSKVVQDIPPFSICDGHPARVFGLNLVGLKRHGVNPDAIKSIKKAFRIIFNTGLPPKRAIEHLSPDLLANKEVSYLSDFVKNSSRGVTRSCRLKNNQEDKFADPSV